MVLTMISPRVKKRFPTLENFVESGLMLENEKQILINLNDKFPKPSKHWFVFYLIFLFLKFKGKFSVGNFSIDFQVTNSMGGQYSD